ncbi:MAG: hypothetical protein ACYTGH_00475 [Planctomycetota bacterium]|jgi:chromosome segregation ATPase
MSIPSKILVVLNVVVSVALAVFSLSLYNKKVNWVEEAHKNIAIRNNTSAKLRQQTEIAEKLTIELKETKTTLTDEVTDLKGSLEKSTAKEHALQGNVDTLTQTNKGFTTELKLIKDEIKEKEAKNRELLGLYDTCRKERANALNDLEFAQRQALEATADLKDSEAQRVAIAKSNASLMEQSIEMRILLDKIRTENPTLLDGKESAVTVQLTSKVLRVREELGLVILSVGESDKVRPGVELVVSRGSTYIGKVRVRSTQKNMCAAIINPDVTVKPIKVGDTAETL